MCKFPESGISPFKVQVEDLDFLRILLPLGEGQKPKIGHYFLDFLATLKGLESGTSLLTFSQIYQSDQESMKS